MKTIRIQGSIQKVGEVSTSQFGFGPEVRKLSDVDIQTPQGLIHYKRIKLPGSLPVPQENTDVQWAAIDIDGDMLVFASRTAEGWQDHGAQMKAEIFSERSFNMLYAACAGMLAFLFLAPAIAQKTNLVVQIMSLSVALVCTVAMLGGWGAAFRLPSQKKLTRMVASLQNEAPVTGNTPAVGS